MKKTTGDMKEQPLPRFFDEVDARYAVRCLTRNVGSALFIATGNKIRYVNETFQELSSYAWQGMRGRTFTSFVHRGDKNIVKAQAAGLHEPDSMSEPFECRIVRQDGTAIWVLMRLALAECREGRALIGSFFDISLRKVIAEKLKASEQRFKMLFEYAPDAYYLSDTLGTILDGNRAAEELTGYAREELIGKNYLKLGLLSSDQIGKASLLLGKNVGGRPTGPDEFVLTRKDGSKIQVAIRTLPHKIAGVAQVLGIARDVTETKRVEAYLQTQALDLRERVKELDCLYAISTIESSPSLTFFEKLQKVVDLIPPAFQYPDFTCARLIFAEKEFKSCNFKTSPFKERVIITLDGHDYGVIEIFYYGHRYKAGADPFLNEEKLLLTAIARHIAEIIKRKQAEETVKEVEEKFETISLAAQHAIIIIDVEGDVTYWNRAAEKTFGYTSEEITGKELHRMITPDRYYDSYRKGFEKFKETGQGNAIGQTLEMEGVRKDGTNIPVELSLAAIKNKGSWNAIGIIRDITERKKTQDKLLYLASHDQLTGLPNRNLFNDRMSVAFSHAQRYGKELAVMVIDMDNFKAINDSMGHDIGDRLLKAVGERMTALLRKSDTVARIGGDEFCLVGQLNGDQTEARLAEKIVKAFAKPFRLNGYPVTETLSIGVSVFPRDGEEIDTLMKKADIALYRAKDAGRNGYQIYSD